MDAKVKAGNGDVKTEPKSFASHLPSLKVLLLLFINSINLSALNGILASTITNGANFSNYWR